MSLGRDGLQGIEACRAPRRGECRYHAGEHGETNQRDELDDRNAEDGYALRAKGGREDPAESRNTGPLDAQSKKGRIAPALLLLRLKKVITSASHG